MGLPREPLVVVGVRHLPGASEHSTLRSLALEQFLATPSLSLPRPSPASQPGLGDLQTTCQVPGFARRTRCTQNSGRLDTATRHCIQGCSVKPAREGAEGRVWERRADLSRLYSGAAVSRSLPSMTHRDEGQGSSCGSVMSALNAHGPDLSLLWKSS